MVLLQLFLNGLQLGAIYALTAVGFSLIFGSTFSLAVVAFALRWSAVVPALVAILTVALRGWVYARKIGGVTGDCFGAANQLTEIAVYFCGVWAV